MIDTQKLPALPDGWHYENDSASNVQVMHVVWPDHGAVSVDFEHRNIASGWCRPGPALSNAKSYAGRGWKAVLIEDAVHRLRVAWA